MYVCICKAITDSDIHEAVEGGVRNMRQLVEETGCCIHCARCVETAVEVLDEALAARRGFLKVVPTFDVA